MPYLGSPGGMPTGFMYGATAAIGGYATQNPVHYRNILATIYHNMGINPHAMVADVSGRPTPILPSSARVIEKLV